MNKLGIYIHVPFCVQKCRYCDFYSMAGAGDVAFKLYGDAICAHLQQMAPFAKEYVVDSVYFGGGTPSLLQAGIMQKIVSALRMGYRLDDSCEMTLEMNPGTADENAMKAYINCGFNRLSIGCQSADDGELKMLGRIHSFADFCQTIELAKKVGFDNISADLMLGLPGQNWETLSHSIDEITKLGPTHISVYALKIEQGTWFYQHRSELVLPEEETERELYLNTVRKLDGLGYRQYEISNFAKCGFASAHNLKYWQCMPYLGFGPSAYSCFEGKRYGYGRDLNAYIQAVQNHDDSAIRLDEEMLTPEERVEEKLMLGLRLSKGICLEEFPFDDGVIPYLQMLSENKLVTESCGRFALTPEGMLVDNYITSELLLHLK